LDLEWKYNLETYTLQRGEAVADYQGRHKPEVNQAGVTTYGTTVPELSIVLCTIWDCLISFTAHENETLKRKQPINQCLFKVATQIAGKPVRIIMLIN